MVPEVSETASEQAMADSARSRRRGRRALAGCHPVAHDVVPTCRDAAKGGAKYEPIAAGEWLMRKHAQTVAGKLCYEAAPARAAAEP